MPPLTTHDVPIRVRYAETDGMGFLYHAQFIVYFEVARTELGRLNGFSYREMEETGLFLVMVDLSCKYRRPARYDDLLAIRTTVERVTHVKIQHRYEVFRDGVLLAEGRTTLACVDRDGRPQRLPPMLLGEELAG